MTLTRSLPSSTALLLILAGPALADLTAEQVLDDQLKQMRSYGLEASVTGQSRSGDTLTVEGLSAQIELPEGMMDVTIGGAFFRELGDGRVEITYPDEIPVTMKGTAADGEEFEMLMSLTQTGTRTIASGIPEELRYDFAADSFSVEDIRFLAPSEAADLDMEVDMTLTGLTGFMELIGGGTLRDYAAEFAFTGISGLISGSAPDDEEGDFSVSFEGSDLTANYEGVMAPQNAMGSLADSVLAGNRTDGTATHGPVTYTIAGSGPDGTFEVAAAVASGTLDFRMDESGMEYGGTSRDMTMTIGGSTIPLPPLTFRMAESGGRFAMPVVPSEDPQGFALRLNLAGLEIDQMLWNMIDPVGQLPRDPAALTIDLGGEVVMAEDVFAPDYAEEMTGPPGQINSLDINQILLTLAGAELTGDGAFTFNNEGMMPMPAGSVNLMLTGANGLLDTLVGMGLIPQEQAMGARMMMGMFARPGDGPDTLVSTIEVTEDGAVLANGQRIK